MSRVSATVAQADLRHLLPAAREQYFERLKDQCTGLYGPGIFNTVVEPNGDVSYTFDYDPHHVAAPDAPAFELTKEEVLAIVHAKVFVANSAHIKQNPATGLYEALNEEALKADPAMAGRIETLNILEALTNRLP